MKKIKNIVVVNDFDFVQGGASKVAIQTANLLAESKNNYNVYFFSAVHSNESILNYRIKRICTNQPEALKNRNKLQGFVNGIYNWKSRNELRKLLNTLDKNETIIHVHGWTKALSSSVFDIAFSMNYKVVLTMHDYFIACPNGGFFNYKHNKICKFKPLSWKCVKCNCDSRNYLFKIYRLMRHFVQNKIIKLDEKLTDVISISEFSENILKNTLNKNIKIHRVYNPINIGEKNEKVNYLNNDYFLYVGRVSKEKGVDVFCEAITKANVHGIVVGDGPEVVTLKEKYNNIKFVGWKSSDEVKNYMLGAKALIFTSRWYETAGLTVLEASSLGIPVIVASNTAATEFVLKEQVFSNSNVEELISIIKKNNFKANNTDFSKYSYNTYLNDIIITYQMIE